MTMSFSVRLRAHSAGLEEVVERALEGAPTAADLLALAKGPLSLLGAVASATAPKEAAVVGLLPLELAEGQDVDALAAKALAHRAAAEAEVVELRAGEGASLAAACELSRSLLASMRGAASRIDEGSLRLLASEAGVSLEEAAVSLAAAGVREISRRVEAFGGGSSSIGPLPIRESWVVPETLDEGWISALVAAAESGRRPEAAAGVHSIALIAGPTTTGVQLLRAVALARIAGFSTVAVGGGDELKGPDACLAFGADLLEAQLDPPGTMGSRTRAYGEAAIQGAQLQLRPPARRAASTKKIAHILDEDVDPSLLPGGDPAAGEKAAPAETSHRLEVQS